MSNNRTIYCLQSQPRVVDSLLVWEFAGDRWPLREVGLLRRAGIESVEGTGWVVIDRHGHVFPGATPHEALAEFDQFRPAMHVVEVGQ
ncbi:hypothetical protein NYA28ABAC_03866 (plasmid) [Salinicola sp. NYA28a]